MQFLDGLTNYGRSSKKWELFLSQVQQIEFVVQIVLFVDNIVVFLMNFYARIQSIYVKIQHNRILLEQSYRNK